MKEFEKQFKIQSTIEQKPFTNKEFSWFFYLWCDMNDFIQLKIISREQWNEQKEKEIIQKKSSKRQVLFVPEDMQLWEMVEIVEKIDLETFDTRPNRQKEIKEKITDMGRNFQNAGIYISKYLDIINDGKEIAESLASDFYKYGQSLISGKKNIRNISPKEIAENKLTLEEIEKIDYFLAGNSLYNSRTKKEKNFESKSERENFREEKRQETIIQFFRIAQKSFLLQKNKRRKELSKNNDIKPWKKEIPIHSAFLKKIKKEITKNIETPKQEIFLAIFRRGLEKLVKEMEKYGWKNIINNFLEPHGLRLEVKQKKIAASLKIEKLKKELAEIRKTENIFLISKKERTIADLIQKAVSKLPYQEKTNSPVEMIIKQSINCVNASMLGGALMKEAGLNYLVGTIPEHSILLLVTSDGKIEWRDMLNAKFNQEITDEMVEKREKKPSTSISDIIAFSKNPNTEGLIFNIKNPKFNEEFFLVIFGPEYGQQIQLLNNISGVFLTLGCYEDSIAICRQIISSNPKLSYTYDILGSAFFGLQKYNKAIEAYRKGIEINPDYEQLYEKLGTIFFNIGKYKNSIDSYRQAIRINPNHPQTFNYLGNAFFRYQKYDKAIEAYRESIKIFPGYHQSYNGLGNAFFMLNLYEEAIKEYNKAIEIKPDYAHCYNNLGNLFFKIKKYKNAIEAYQKFIELADRESEQHWIEQIEEMIKDLKKIIKSEENKNNTEK